MAGSVADRHSWGLTRNEYDTIIGPLREAAGEVPDDHISVITEPHDLRDVAHPGSPEVEDADGLEALLSIAAGLAVPKFQPIPWVSVIRLPAAHHRPRQGQPQCQSHHQRRRHHTCCDDKGLMVLMRL